MDLSTAVCQADPSNAVSMAVAVKALKLSQQEGAGILQLLEAVAESAAEPGKGEQVDLRA